MPIPLANARVELVPANRFSGPDADPGQIVRTDEYGRFSYPGVRSGPYRLRVTREGYLRKEYGETGLDEPGPPIRISTGEPMDVRFVLDPAPTVSGRITDEAGEALPDMLVTALRSSYDLRGNRLLDRDPTPDDYLFVMWTPDGERVESVAVALATGDGLGGSLLRDPGVELPAGAGLFASAPDGRPLFAGLVAGRATVEGGSNAGRYYVVAGVDRVRELLAVPQRHPVDLQPKYRTDDITVMEPGAPPPPESERQQTLPGPGVLFPGLLPPTPGTVLPGTTTPGTTDPPK
jgi:hypothetical protein